MRKEISDFCQRIKGKISMRYGTFVVGYKGEFTKTVTKRDNELFAELSGDYNPLHFDDSIAKDFGFEQRVSNGFVTESRVAAALVETFGSDETLVFALRKNTKFLKPVYMDDEITATVEVVDRWDTMNLLKIKAECRNQHSEIVSKTSMEIKIVERKS